MFDSSDDLFDDDEHDAAGLLAACERFGFSDLLHEAPMPQSPSDYASLLASSPEALNLGRGELGDHGLALLSSALTVPPRGASVRSLDIERNGLTAEGAKSLAGALRAGAVPSLEVLSLTHNAIGGDGFAAIAVSIETGALTELDSLDVNSNRVGDTGLIALGKAVANGVLCKLSKLYLGGNDISDDGVIAFAAAVGTGGGDVLPALYELWLSNNEIGDKGFAALCAMLKQGALTNLGDLRLQYNHLGDASCSSLVGLLKCGSALYNTWYLGLNDNAFTNEGLNVLETALAGAALPRLEFITASSPNSTAAAQQAVQNAFTNRPRPPRPTKG